MQDGPVFCSKMPIFPTVPHRKAGFCVGRSRFAVQINCFAYRPTSKGYIWCGTVWHGGFLVNKPGKSGWFYRLGLQCPEDIVQN